MTFKIMKNEEYHASEGLSSTTFRKFLKSPAHYAGYMREKREKTPSQLLGSAVHTLVLEPDKFKAEYIVINGRKDSKENKEILSRPENKEKIIITDTVIEKAVKMSDSVKYHVNAQKIMRDTKKELSIFVKEPTFKFLMKSRFDFQSANYLGDLKTCGSIDPEELQRHMFQMRYDVQAWFYLYCMKQINPMFEDNFYFIFVSDEPELLGTPDAVLVTKVRQETLDRASETCMPALARYAECLQENNFSNDNNAIIDIGLPAWVK